jgi:hypothetical protein
VPSLAHFTAGPCIAGKIDEAGQPGSLPGYRRNLDRLAYATRMIMREGDMLNLTVFF